MEIIFVRHAEKEDLGEDPNLTKKGVKQSEYLAKSLKKEKIDRFYCSDLNRAKQTAQIVSKQISINPKIENSLNEFESYTVKSPKNKWNKEEKEHYNNLTLFLKGLMEDPNKDEVVLIIAHGVTNRIIASYFLGLNLVKMIQFTQKEAGLNSIYWKDKFKNWRLRVWNDDSHIPKKLKGNKFY